MPYDGETAIQGWNKIARMFDCSVRKMQGYREELQGAGYIFYKYTGPPPRRVVCAFPSYLKRWAEQCNFKNRAPLYTRIPYVYFVQNEDGYIKIGTTRHVKRRLMAIQGNNCQKVKLIGKVKGDHNVEARLHRKFKEYRKRGEWFNPAPELLEYISTHKIYKGESLG